MDIDTTMRTAGIAVAAAIYSIDKAYVYIIPEEFENKAKVGMRVLVPFGKGARITEGVVLVLDPERQPEPEKLKTIEKFLDSEPIFSSEDIQLALWMRDRYFCTFFEAARTLIPDGMRFNGGEKQKASEKSLMYASLTCPPEEAIEVSELMYGKLQKQSEILRLLAVTGDAPISDILTITGASRGVVNSLVKKGLIITEKREVQRHPFVMSDERITEPIELTPEQERAYNTLAELLNSKAQAALLYGVTGSGKTMVYIKLVQQTLMYNRTAIVLVPEISLTPQLVRQFSGYFGSSVAVLHSSLTMGERYDEWKRIKSGDVSVVIGTRSAVFAPLKNIGLIVIDEEQEYTYKSESAPRYHAREVAKYRCVRENALLVLGSATPSLESMYEAKKGNYKFCAIRERYNERSLPNVIVADMRKDLEQGDNRIVGSVLRGELQRNIENGEQSILFLNRRGASKLVVCGICGYTFTCPNCSVSLTYHTADEKLHCHYCGFMRNVPHDCPKCGGKIKFIGFGTQKMETELQDTFPGIDIIRMDLDTVSRAGSHRKLLDKFENEKVPILLGTQMITKGLDFENVTLVGVISADQLIYASDFRAWERAFSLMTQVIGRAGRGSKAGRAVIQTYTPENKIIALAANQDYDSFYEQEIQFRSYANAPPIRELISMSVVGTDEKLVYDGIFRLRDMLEANRDVEIFAILGPVPARVVKVNNRFRYKIHLQCTNNHRLRQLLSMLIAEFMNDKLNRGLTVITDTYPTE